MVLIYTAYQQDASAEILKKCGPAVYSVTTDDIAGMGFAVGGGKFLITTDHVIGSDAKITIHHQGEATRHGYLVFHDPKLDIAVYRMDRVSPYSLKITSQTVVPDKPVFVIGGATDEATPTVFKGTIGGVQRDADRANVLFNGLVSVKYAGSPILNANGEVVAMSQVPGEGGRTMTYGISGYSLTQFLKAQSSPAIPTRPAGKIVQVTTTASVYATPELTGQVIDSIAPGQVLIADDYNEQFMKVSRAEGETGYILAGFVSVMSQNVTTGTPGVASGYEVIRVLSTFDQSTLHPTTTNAEWTAECARFVGEVFATAGRDISEDSSIQLDIGRDVMTPEDLQPGDRIYIGTEKDLKAAIYIGNNQFVSISKEGKMVKSALPDVEKPYYRAKH